VNEAQVAKKSDHTIPEMGWRQTMAYAVPKAIYSAKQRKV
jgi:hypothetical protein